MTRIVLLALLLFAHGLDAGVAEDYLRDIRQVALDPDRCYRVRDVFLEREDIKLYFTDGYLIFGEKVHGRDIAFAFVATDPSDVGEVLMIPPTPGERQSIARFLDETLLDEKFRTAAFFFTDDTAEELIRAIDKSDDSKLDAEAGGRLATRWSTVVRNLLGGAALRVFADSYSGLPETDGFFAGAIRGSRLGRFDISIDPRLKQQIGAGKFVRTRERGFYEVWTSFEAKSFREGNRQVVPGPGRLRNYRIESELAPDLRMDVRAVADFYPRSSQVRSFDFELSGRLEVSEILLDGEPVEFLQKELPFQSGASRRRNNLVLVVLPEPLEAESKHELEFRYGGTVITDAGSGVYYVGDRGSWYPRADIDFSNYELTFRYPEHLELVATGTRVEDSVGDGIRTSVFRSDQPIRLAGFNLGRYLSTTREIDGYTIDIHATEVVEQRLQPKPMVAPMPPSQSTLPNRRRSRYGLRPPVPPLILDAPRPTTVKIVPRLEEVADQCAAAFQFFVERFGDLALKKVVISPVPGDFGQGFPGLVYASTKSYFRPGDSPLARLPADEVAFYTKLLAPHELAHQWWGNAVTVNQPGDGWIMEGLATYSSLLFLEYSEGRAVLDSTLSTFQKRLLDTGDDDTSVESAGPVVLGERLRTSKSPRAYRIIVYEKGAWIFHMLRSIMGDDEFFAFLRELREEFESRSIRTADLRELALRHVPADYLDPELNEFFDLWVYRTGVPRVRIRYDQKKRDGRHVLTASLSQSEVDDRFSVVVPLRIETDPGKVLNKSILTEGPTTEFSVVLRNRATRVEIDPENTLLIQRD